LGDLEISLFVMRSDTYELRYSTRAKHGFVTSLIEKYLSIETNISYWGA